MKRTPLIIGGIAGVALLWAGAWYAGKVFYVEPRADAAVEQLRSGTTFISFDKRTISGFPFGYDVTYQMVAVSDASTLWRWTTPVIRLETGVVDAGELTVTVAEASVLVVEPAMMGAVDGSPMVFDILSDDLTVTLSGGAAESQAEINAAKITMNQKEGVSVVSGGQAELTGMAAEISARGEEGAYTGDIDAEAMSLSYRLSLDGVSESSNQSEMTGIEIDFETLALSGGDLGQMIAKDGMARFEFSAKTYRGDASSTGGPSAPPVTASYKGGKSSALIAVEDGRARYAGQAGDIDMKVVMDGPSPFPVPSFALDGFTMAMEMPLKQAAEAQPYSISVELDDLEIDETMWAAFDPLKKLDRDAIEMDLSITGGARVLTDFLGAQMTQSPIDLETLAIDKFEAEALGVEINAQGVFEIAGDASRSDGDMTVNVEGGLGLLDDLVAAGLVPVQALGAYQALIAQFTVRDGDDDKLTTKIESRRGQVSINGQVVSQ